MKSIKINNQEIVVTYNESKKAEKIYRMLYPFEQKRCSVEGNVLTYKMGSSKHIYYTVKDLFRKSNYGTDVSFEEFHGNNFDLYSGRLNAFVGYDKVFRITPVRDDGVLGVYDFGVHQYNNFISFVEVGKTGEFVFISGRYHVDEFEHHQLKLDGFSVLIEVVSLQF